jgi:four helix bundle protein
MRITDHRDLWVYRESCDLAVAVEELTKSYPQTELYRLTDQTIRSSRAPTGMIPEAWRKRHYPLVFKSKLLEAEGEIAETQNWLCLAARLGHAPQEIVDELVDRYSKLLAGILNMRLDWKRWCNFKPNGDD